MWREEKKEEGGKKKRRKKASKKDPAIRWFSLCVLWETTRKKIRTDLFLSTASEKSRLPSKELVKSTSFGGLVLYDCV